MALESSMAAFHLPSGVTVSLNVQMERTKKVVVSNMTPYGKLLYLMKTDLRMALKLTRSMHDTEPLVLADKQHTGCIPHANRHFSYHKK